MSLPLTSTTSAGGSLSSSMSNMTYNIFGPGNPPTALSPCSLPSLLVTSLLLLF